MKCENMDSLYCLHQVSVYWYRWTIYASSITSAVLQQGCQLVRRQYFVFQFEQINFGAGVFAPSKRSLFP